jgi:hypothetical protein
MNNSKETYRVSITFPMEMVKLIRSKAQNDDRTFTWEVVNLLKAQLAQEQKEVQTHE